MLNSKTLKTRVLALALTVLMVIGMLPMTVFALSPVENSVPSGAPLDTGAKFVAPTVGDITKKVGASSILFYNYYNALTPGEAFDTTGGIGASALDGRTPGEVVSDGNGGAVYYTGGHLVKAEPY